ncbi:MAG: site-specific integrase [Planctomycetota bacterium]|nr:site-specific integrase [Planctomycetota bacterium]
MATLRRRGKNYFVDYRFHGRRIRKPAGPNLRAAKELLMDVQGRLVRDDAGLGVLDKNGENALEEFLEDRRARNSEKWADYQEAILTDFLEVAGVRLLRQITPVMIERWQRARAKETSVSTARTNFTTLRCWLRWAKGSKYLQENPSDFVSRLPAPPRKEIRFITPKEAEKLFKACREPVPLLGPGKKGNGSTRERKTPLFELAAVALYAGLRLGEILHLHWEDVDFKTNGGVLHVRVRDSFVPKDKEGRRIPLHSRLQKILRAYQKRAKKRQGAIFQTTKETAFHGRNLVRELQKAAVRAGIKGGCNFYTLRRTFGSWLTMNGVSMHKISKFLGHASITTTEKHYAGLVPETLHHDIERLGP